MSEVSTLTAEAIRHLQALVQLDTSNPPGHESLAAHYLAEILRNEGLEPTLLEKVPGRANLIVRLQGQGQPPPLLLMGHTDVVPAELEAWSHDPFGATVDGGFVWGRGTLDMKFMLAYELALVLHIKRLGLPLKRDVIFAATADEEGFGADRCGMAYVVREAPELVRAEFALNEMGGFTVWIGDLPVYPVIVGEKAACRLVVRATGEPGHASELAPDSAVIRLCSALTRLNQLGLPAHPNRVARKAVQTIVEAMAPCGTRWLARRLARMLFSIAIPEALKQHPAFTLLYSATHNTAVPTSVHAGNAFNVVPSQAEAVLNGRYLPGVDVEEFEAEVRAALGRGVFVESQGHSAPLEFSFETELFDIIQTTVQALHPGSVVIPWLMSGSTDAAHVAKLGTIVYGFSPVQWEPGFDWRGLMHGVDERIPLSGIPFGVAALWEVVRGFVTTGC